MSDCPPASAFASGSASAASASSSDDARWYATAAGITAARFAAARTESTTVWYPVQRQ